LNKDKSPPKLCQREKPCQNISKTKSPPNFEQREKLAKIKTEKKARQN
jgi:hypothetical protein